MPRLPLSRPRRLFPSRPSGRWLRWIPLIPLLALTIWAADQALPPPDGAQLDYSTEIQDRHGDPLRLYTTQDGYWRLPVQLKALDARFLDLLFAYEDRRFLSHAGVDPLALARAATQALREGRFVSGGSTLTMQVAKLLEPRPRTLGAKLREMLRAWQLERRLSKEQILALYLELAPYGGNLQGIRAASRFYFGKEPHYLTLAEAALLVALPQSPERRRPDRHPQAALQARNQVLERLAGAGVLTLEDAGQAQAQPLGANRAAPPRQAPHLGDRLRLALGPRPLIRTSLDGRLQRRLEGLMSRHQQSLPDGVTLASLILDNASGQALAYAGSGEYLASSFPGQVDMVAAVRSPGSSLKPFLYGLAFDAGLLHPETLIGDRPGPVDGYAPLNFDKAFRGELRVRDALRASRNIPAVRVLSRVGPSRFLATLEQGGARLRLPKGTFRPGLPVALGGVGIRLEDLTRLYAGLARQGASLPVRYLADEPAAAPAQFLSPVASWYLTDILVGSSLPQGFVLGGRKLAFKTGTSYGFRDAWAIGYNATHTAGVWLGRPDGGYTSDLTGLQAAVPVLMQLFDLLPPDGVEPLLRNPPDGVLRVSNAQLPPHLRLFDLGLTRSQRADPEPGPRILYPPDGSQVELSRGPEAGVQVEAQGGEPPFHWLVDGRLLGSSDLRRLDWHPAAAGPAQLTLIDQRGRSHGVRVDVRLPAPPPLTEVMSTAPAGSNNGRDLGAGASP